MTGREYLEYLGQEANAQSMPLAVSPSEQRIDALSPSLPGFPLREKWWETVDPAKALAAVAARKQLLREEKGGPEPLDELIQLGAVGCTVALGTLDAATAVEQFTELAADLGNAKRDGQEIRIWVPYLPRSLSLKEATALAALLNRQTDPASYGPHLATLAAGDALRGTSYLDGIRSLQFFESADGYPVPGDWYKAWRFAEEFRRLGNSGLAPRLSGMLPAADKRADATLEVRRRNIQSLRIGIRVPVFSADNTTKQWVSPEEALAVIFRQLASPAEQFETAYPAWVARRGAVPHPDSPERPLQRAVAVVSGAPYMSADNDKLVQEIAHVRRSHLFPHAMVRAEGGQYPADNDLGVAACLHGDFSKSEEHFIAASQLDIGPGLLARRMATGCRLTRRCVTEIEVWSLAESGSIQSPEVRIYELSFALEAQRNLAYLWFLQGRFDDALSIMHKVHEAERRGAADRHPDAAFRPLSLAAFFGPDVAPLESAARALHEAAEAMFRRDVVRAEELVTALPQQFRTSRLATQLQLDIHLARLAWPDEVLSKDKQHLLLLKAERLARELSARPLDGNPAFVKHPGWLVVHAGIEDAIAKPLWMTETPSPQLRRSAMPSVLAQTTRIGV